MKKLIIQEFDPQIYPRLFWVCLNANAKDLSDLFEFNGEYKDLVESIEKSYAVTSIVRRRKDGRYGAIVYSKNKKFITGSVIAHESVHVADIYFQELGMISQDFNTGNEPYAYLVGWAAKCINQARVGVNNSTINTL